MGYGSSKSALLQKYRFCGIVDQINDRSSGIYFGKAKRKAFVFVGKGSNGGALHDDGEILKGNGRGLNFFSGPHRGGNAEVLENVKDGKGGATISENEGCFLMGLGYFSEGLFKSGRIGIVPFESAVGHFFDGIYRADGGSCWIDFVEKGNHGLFVGDGYVEAVEERILLKQKLRIGKRGIEEEIFGGGVLLQKLVFKVVGRKRMGEGSAEESVVPHGVKVGKKLGLTFLSLVRSSLVRSSRYIPYVRDTRGTDDTRGTMAVARVNFRQKISIESNDSIPLLQLLHAHHLLQGAVHSLGRTIQKDDVAFAVLGEVFDRFRPHAEHDHVRI